MSKENLILFLEKVQQDESLKAQLNQISSKKEFHHSDIVQLARENGFNFNESDIEEMNQETSKVVSGEALGEAQLEAVTGGTYPPEFIHFLNWLCDSSYRDRYSLF